MIKIVALVRRKPDLPHDRFVRYWQDHHSHVVAALPGLRAYVQNPAYEAESRDWPFDGMAELWFDDVAAVKAAFQSPEAAAVRQDELEFVDSIDWFLADEHPIIRPPVDA